MINLEFHMRLGPIVYSADVSASKLRFSKTRKHSPTAAVACNFIRICCTKAPKNATFVDYKISQYY